MTSESGSSVVPRNACTFALPCAAIFVTAMRVAKSQIVRNARRAVWVGSVRVDRGAWEVVEDFLESRRRRRMKMEVVMARRRQPTY